MRTFPGGATRDDDTDKYDYEGFLSPIVLERFAQYMHWCRVQADGKLRDSDNWQRRPGIPRSEYMKSKFRHFMETWKLYRLGGSSDQLEESLCAEMFNTMGLLYELLECRRGDDPDNEPMHHDGWKGDNA